MPLQLSYTRHTLQFKFDARTSRGAISEHQVYYLKVWDTASPSVYGVGECAPLAGLSIDYRPDLEQKLQQVAYLINEGEATLDAGAELPAILALQEWPALRFALETALLDLQQGGKKRLFDNNFSRGEAGIPINGLVWMGDRKFMQEQIEKKMQEGYNCLKLKIGSLDFTTELNLLQQIREVAGSDSLTVRVDANGAFTPQEAYKKLERLARYELHSIEQPIRQGQVEEMAQLCAYTPVPIALDEELIGVQEPQARKALLECIHPQYIILKPTLVGGLAASAEWIKLAEERSIGWWITSALESNIGLNAISQFTAQYDINMPQGLGTGQLYHNNIASPLQIEQGELWYKPAQQEWAFNE
ncbi:o-succinylbenzoate synthase [Pontibacter akesuensis]|uniref:O-succinylbenzoate synthase n=1 Tax=Pontibacter akesuensis TaxID=388950 RepID=A0A1I7FY91_9BACT|nr:o-succinylbenzoate synthase [Pontibacter akesuensis]GHA59908.1 o-succinylbenzoate synthase [Pontibacter akesuensis]SFU41123.1 o-succinylbenzoate synthase [Pontibacter akesuensis]